MIVGPFTPLSDEIVNSTAARLLSPGGFACLVDFLARWSLETRNGQRDRKAIPFSWTSCRRVVDRKAWLRHRKELIEKGFIVAASGGNKQTGHYSMSESWRDYQPTLFEAEAIRNHEARQAADKKHMCDYRALVPKKDQGPWSQKGTKGKQATTPDTNPSSQKGTKGDNTVESQKGTKAPWSQKGTTPLVPKRDQDPDPRLADLKAEIPKGVPRRAPANPRHGGPRRGPVLLADILGQPERDSAVVSAAYREGMLGRIHRLTQDGPEYVEWFGVCLDVLLKHGGSGELEGWLQYAEDCQNPRTRTLKGIGEPLRNPGAFLVSRMLAWSRTRRIGLPPLPSKTANGRA